ncbi:MAG: type II secretion system protein GspD [Bacillota bacterium]
MSAFLHFARGSAHALWALLFAALALASAPAAAQQFKPITRPPTYPVVLTGIKLLNESASESRFEFDFDPTATTYATAMGPPNQPGLGFASTTRGRTAVQPRDMKGLVRNLEFQQVQDILIVRFDATKAASFSAAQTGDKSIEVTVRSNDYNPAEAADAGAALGPAPLPPAYEPPESYALVLLKYADVSEVVGLLTDGQTVKSNDVFIPSEPAFGSNSLTGNTYQPQAQTQAPGANDDPLGQSIDANIGIDRRLNAVWLKGTPERIAQMKAMIAAIDIPVDSVVLETQFVELTEQGLKALGLDFNNANGQLGVVTFQTGQFIPPGVPAGSHLTSTQFQAALYAQISKGNGRIVSRPRISAQSGSTAKIITGDALPILTSIALSGVNGVSQQVQYVNVGVTLQIAPRVSGDGWVSSHVFAVVSSVTGTSQGYPTISQREAETSATVRDGDSFVIGGLTQDETISTKSKIPLLGDIPLVGLAFRNERTTRSKTELYIIVTPHIVHRVGSNPNVTPANAPLYATPAPTAPPTDISPPPPAAVPQQR